MDLKVRMVRYYPFSVLSYGVESGTLTEATLKRLDAFEKWIYRRILRITWVDHGTKEKGVINTVKKRKLYFGDAMRHLKHTRDKSVEHEAREKIERPG